MANIKTTKAKLLSLNQSGLAHLLYPILGLAVILVIASAGFYVYQQNQSGAGTHSARVGTGISGTVKHAIRPPTGIVTVKAWTSGPCKVTAKTKQIKCTAKPSKADLIVSMRYPGSLANPAVSGSCTTEKKGLLKKISDGKNESRNFGSARTLYCTAAGYKFSLASAKILTKELNGIDASKEELFIFSPSAPTPINLGATK